MALGTTLAHSGRLPMQRLALEEFAAFVGLDWAEAKHDICLQAAGTERREFSSRPPPRGERCVGTGPPGASRTTRRGVPGTQHRPSRLCLAGIGFPGALSRQSVHPRQVPRRLSPGHAKDDPTDAALQLELPLKHREKLSRSSPRARDARLRATRRTLPPSGWRQRASHQPPDQYPQKLLSPCPAMV